MSLGVTIPDAGDRRRALDPRRSFIVQAPAGSGKTELLIQRYLVLLATVERPEEIAAITFTRKAAGEMRARVFEALAAARGPRPEGAHHAITHDLARAVLARDAELGWRLEENASRLKVQTIDALCVSLTRQMPVLSRFGAQPESIDDATALYAEAARATLAALEVEGDSAADGIEHLLSHLDNNVPMAEGLIASLLASRDHWLHAVGAAPDRAALEGTLLRVCAASLRQVGALMPPGFALPPDDDVAAWKALADGWLTKDGKWRKKPAPAPAALQAVTGLDEALHAVRELPDTCYTELQWEALNAITRLMPRATAELKLVFERRGQADFVEISQAAIRALHTDEGPTDLLLALDYRIRHLLVDEFQDTSYTQEELLKRLTSGWEEGDGRTLFLVGDPMQSIYRFRQAEVGIFLAARGHGLGSVSLEPLTLRANFRSQAGIVEWVNAAFANVMPGADDATSGAVSYAPSAAVHPHGGPAVEVHAFYDDDLAGEGQRVAVLVREALAAPGKDDAPSTVAILVRSRAHLVGIVPQLRAAGLRFQAVEIEGLGQRPVVQDLLSLTRALSHLADRIAWLAVLRAPWCGLLLRDLEILVGEDRRAPLWDRIHDPEVHAALTGDGQRRLARLAGVLSHAWEGRARGSLRDAVEGAWLALGGPACVTDPTDFEDAEAYLDHLEASEEAGRLPSLEAFEAGLGRLFAAPDLAAAPTLQVMTVHRAKGLEFDTVVLPRLGATPKRDDRGLFIWLEVAHGMLLAPMNPSGSEADPIYEFIRKLDRSRAEHEDGRLLYVAATRARSRLHLMGDCRRTPEGAAKEPARGTLLARLWPTVCHAFAQVPAAAARPLAAAAPRPPDLERLAAPPTFEIPAPFAWSPAQADRAREAIEFSWAGRAAREVGSVVHRWLQHMADDALRGWDSARITRSRPAIAQQLAARGVADAEALSATDRVVAALQAAITDAKGRWILGPQLEARNEQRITVRIDGVLRQLVIDRNFRDAEGRRWIVDYKTSSHEGGDLEGFLDRELERYTPQLTGYATALGGTHISLGLYFPLVKGWRENTPPAAAASPAPGKSAGPAQLSLELFDHLPK